MSNRLKHETSPYLLQHKDNPVDWYPWCDEAFEKARKEDKPVFLSIGYSTCHWCHVLAHESFEDSEISDMLNRWFISVKVDKEERPDIDSVYMTVCQAFTGGGGWPLSIFMTADKKPFFAGTYFPKTSRGGIIGMRELVSVIHEKWINDRSLLLRQADKTVALLNSTDKAYAHADQKLIQTAVKLYKHSYDKKHGGFGSAPKFPAPHNIIFLLSYYEYCKDEECLAAAEHTLLQMYRGGLFDHIGFGFCRYSTDERFLAPHFEKMLYDNALLISAYCKAYSVTEKEIYLNIAEKTADYILREMTSADGGFYSAQDADSDGEEGKYYLFTPDEIIGVLGSKRGQDFNRHFDISTKGNFEGKNIPNLLKSEHSELFNDCLKPLREYRKKRCRLHLDDKILTFWNSLMIAAMCDLYLVNGKERYLDAALRADAFIQKYLYENDTLFVSFRNGKRSAEGFSDDYAGYMFAQLSLYKATLQSEYIKIAERLYDKMAADFADGADGFFIYGNNSEKLISRPKETYDGAIPCANSFMAHNLVRLSYITGDNKYTDAAVSQLDFIAADAASFPTGHAMFLSALLQYIHPPVKITVVPDSATDIKTLPFVVARDSVIVVQKDKDGQYPLKDNRTTYYVCKDHSCLPPSNFPPGI